VLNSLPLICAALISGAGEASGIEALQAAAWNRPDAEARLETFLGTNSSDDPNRLAATVLLRDLSMSRFEYRRAHELNQQASELAGRSLAHLSEDLVDAPPQVAQTQDDVLPITWGLMGLPRIDARFGTAQVSALVDTGAEYAVVTETFARRAGLTRLQGAVSVGGTSGRAVSAGFSLAEIAFGRSRFSNAVVLIVPDRALTFPMGLKIDAIVGMPQLRAFAAVAFSEQSLKLRTVAPSDATATPNIAFDGWRLIAPVMIEGNQTWMLIDTGARRSSVYLPPDDAAPEDGRINVRGVGGSQMVRGTTGPATLQFAEQQVTVNELQRRVLERPSQGCTAPGPRSFLGQDFLRRRAFQINFNTMRLDWISD
jgi:predicted aspartyl protease